MPMPAPTELPAWKELQRHHGEIAARPMRALFAEDPARFAGMTIRCGELLLDFSKNRITLETVALLARLAREAGVETMRTRMFAGEPINNTEGRAVLHVALRNRSGRPMNVAGQDVMGDVRFVLE